MRINKLALVFLIMIFVASFLPVASGVLADATPVSIDGAISTGTASDGSSISFSHTTGTSDNRLLLVAVAGNNYETAYDITSVTFTPSGESAISLTEVGDAFIGEGRRSEIWSLLDPPSGETGDVEVIFTANINYGIVASAVNFTGVNQATPLGTFAGASADDLSPTVTLTGLAGNELIFDSLYVGGDPASPVTVGAGQTVLWDVQEGTYLRSASSTEQATGSSVTMSWTRDESGRWAIAAVPIIPASDEIGLLGDVNDDDVVNSTDALIILSCDVGIDTSSFCPMNPGDVNDDGLINSTDALIILSYDVGITVPYSLGEPGYPSEVTPCPGCTP